MQPTVLKWSIVAVLASFCIYGGTVITSAQNPPGKEDDPAAKIELVLKKLDELSKKSDDMAAKIDRIQKDVEFIKARGR